MKPVVWLGNSKADLKAFPATAMDDMGHQLFRVAPVYEGTLLETYAEIAEIALPIADALDDYCAAIADCLAQVRHAFVHHKRRCISID